MRRSYKQILSASRDFDVPEEFGGPGGFTELRIVLSIIRYDEAEPHFTYSVFRWQHRDLRCVGPNRAIVMRFWPEIAPVIRLNLASAATGAPQQAAEDAFFGSPGRSPWDMCRPILVAALSQSVRASA